MGSSYDLASLASTIDRGVIAAKTASVLSGEKHRSLEKEELATIGAAASLIRDILAGARTLTDQGPSGASPQGISSLGIALDPLDRLRLVRGESSNSEDVVVTLLSKILNSLQSIQSRGSVTTETGDHQIANQFFNYLADSLLSNITRSSLSELPG